MWKWKVCVSGKRNVDVDVDGDGCASMRTRGLLLSSLSSRSLSAIPPWNHLTEGFGFTVLSTGPLTRETNGFGAIGRTVGGGGDEGAGHLVASKTTPSSSYYRKQCMNESTARWRGDGDEEVAEKGGRYPLARGGG
jgi:hypothetical protein